ncbi:hypothetical protein [Mucilaginibacter gilvus]|uniref:Uncharacterized protein n=1 Tax=Mucilaginibacter gilvus TaxID=2305909 RepID=A0A444MKN6_9SPHI|nr:hypothetical protein [Mucilaginibacter gilvus]RWY49415.1 hypothetical protein EPL05_18595 [Mucilaginibacter gilvus]
MKIATLIFLFFSSALYPATEKSQAQSFSKAAFYAILASGKLEEINRELTLLATAELPEKQAYEGTLLMRKAGLVKIPGQKLIFFKKGRIKLESALLDNNSNGEFYFLRLIIQEHAPKIVKYRKEIEADKLFVKTTYKTLPLSVQQAISDYSKNSKILHPQDLSL